MYFPPARERVLSFASETIPASPTNRQRESCWPFKSALTCSGKKGDILISVPRRRPVLWQPARGSLGRQGPRGEPRGGFGSPSLGGARFQVQPTPGADRSLVRRTRETACSRTDR